MSLPISTYASNIRLVLAEARPADYSEGYLWYPRSHAWSLKLSRESGYPLDSIVGVLAALSPGNEWLQNKVDTERIVNAHKNGVTLSLAPRAGSYGTRNIAKAYRILDGEPPLDVLGGDKVRAFYATILDPFTTSAVVIDRHAAAAALNDASPRTGAASKERAITKRLYREISEAYTQVSQEEGLPVSALQATVWCVWKRVAGTRTLKPGFMSFARDNSGVIVPIPSSRVAVPLA